MAGPEPSMQVVIDCVHVVRAAADESQSLEPFVGNDVSEKERLRERDLLSRLIIQLPPPQELKPATLQRLPRNSWIRPHPRCSLRVSVVGRPILPSTSL